MVARLGQYGATEDESEACRPRSRLGGLIGILVLPLPFRIKLSRKENNMSP